MPSPYLQPGLNLVVGSDFQIVRQVASHLVVVTTSGLCPYATTVRKGPGMAVHFDEGRTGVLAGLRQAGATAETMQDITIIDDPDSLMEVPKTPDPDRKIGEPLLERLLRRVRDAHAVLVIIDPITSLIPARSGIGQATRKLRAAAEEHGFVVLGPMYGDPRRPSKPMAEWMRVATSTIFAFSSRQPSQPETNDHFVMAHFAVQRGVELGTAQEFSLRKGWLGSVPKLELGESTVASVASPATVKGRAVELMHQVLAKGPVDRDEVVRVFEEEHDIHRTQTYAARTALGVTTEKVRDPATGKLKRFWALPGSVVSVQPNADAQAAGVAPIPSQVDVEDGDGDAIKARAVVPVPVPGACRDGTQGCDRSALRAQQAQLLREIGLATADRGAIEAHKEVLRHRRESSSDPAQLIPLAVEESQLLRLAIVTAQLAG